MSLLRHELFDRRRRKILESHLSKVPSADDVNVITLARRTLGFSAVDLAYLINNAVLKVLADGGKAVDMNALEFALMGSQRLRSSIPLLSATIVPRECHLGVVCQESHADETRQQLLARLDVYMGGRYAAEVSFGSTGVTSSESDLFLATSFATAMVTRYGMSSKLGPVSHIVDSGMSSK
ncbi:AAA ATPase afg3 [Trifolium repens]|nr:AAA ATPase afg3 [Trifolium repens]